MEKRYFVYIMTNQWNTVLYTGVTSRLPRRTVQHKDKVHDGFTKNYNVNKLVYIEEFANPTDAIRREKQIKGGSRRKKIELTEKDNPDWKDLSEDFR